MRYALIADIHANLPAPEVVLGDVVGCAPWPNEVVGLLRERRIAGVAVEFLRSGGAVR